MATNQNLPLEERIKELSNIFSKKKTCVSSHGAVGLSRDDHYYLPQSTKHAIVVERVKEKPYSPLKKYLARLKLKRIYKESSNEEVKKQVKELLVESKNCGWLNSLLG